MKEINLQAPYFKLAPKKHQLLNKIRITTDILGLGVVYLLGPYIPGSFQWLVEIYSFLAWGTIFMIDPSHLPEAGTTRLKQQQAFKLGMLFLPLYATILALLFNTVEFKFSYFEPNIGLLLNVGISAILFEVYFRNIVQVLLRKWGLSVWGAIVLQSLLFGFMFYIKYKSLLLLISMFFIGLLNGWISYKTRSLLFNVIITSFLMYFI